MISHLLILIGAVAITSASSNPLPPSQDAFNTPPSTYADAAPGTILRLRSAPGNLTSTFGNASAVYNILFRTTDTNYAPSYAWTTLFVPKSNNGSNASSNALLSYQVPYNTPDVDAGPSTLLYGSVNDLGLIYSDIQSGLAKGWYVNVPDFEGPKGSFLCGVQEGHATIDSIRSVTAWTGDKTKVALWGYSGGSIASLFALELQVQYAPELRHALVGTAVGGLVPNITTAIPFLAENSTFAGLIPAFMVGFATQHPDFDAYLQSQLLPIGDYNASTFFSVKNMSIAQAFTAFAGQDMYRYFTAGRQVFSSPTISIPIARDATLGYHGSPTVPLYVYKAVHDEISPVEDADALVKGYCQGGANVVYERNGIGGHLAEETNGDARALGALEQMLGGIWKGGEGGCVVRNVAVNVTDSLL